MNSARLSLARSFLGTPYRHQGRSPRIGLDCVGLLTCYLHGLGVETPADRLDYSAFGNTHLLLSRIGDTLEEIPICAAIPGDVLLISARPKHPPTHLAILTDQGILHVTERRVVSEHGLDEDWICRLASAWRIKG